MMDGSQATGLHICRGGTKVPSSETERTRSGGDSEEGPKCLVLSSLRKMQEKAQAVRRHAGEGHAAWWLTLSRSQSRDSRGGGSRHREPPGVQSLWRGRAWEVGAAWMGEGSGP